MSTAQCALAAHCCVVDAVMRRCGSDTGSLRAIAISVAALLIAPVTWTLSATDDLSVSNAHRLRFTLLDGPEIKGKPMPDYPAYGEWVRRVCQPIAAFTRPTYTLYDCRI